MTQDLVLAEINELHRQIRSLSLKEEMKKKELDTAKKALNMSNMSLEQLEEEKKEVISKKMVSIYLYRDYLRHIDRERANNINCQQNYVIKNAEYEKIVNEKGSCEQAQHHLRNTLEELKNNVIPFSKR